MHGDYLENVVNR